MKYELSKETIQNLMVFLNRVDYKGLEEVSAINNILKELIQPIQETSEHSVQEFKKVD